MHREPDVTALGEGRPAGMDADPNPDVDAVAPAVGPDRPLHRDCRVDRGRGSFEDREELVAPSVDLATAGLADGLPQQATELVQDGAVAIAQPVHQLGRAFDIGQDERDQAAR